MAKYQVGKCNRCGMLGKANTIHILPPLRHPGRTFIPLPCLGKFTPLS